MDQKAATQQGGAGGGGGHKRPGAVEATGGYVNYVLHTLNLALAWFGWFITMCGLSAAQHYVKKRRQDITNIPALIGDYNYKVEANYPNISGGKLFRLDWFILFFEFIVLAIVSIGTASSLLRQVRISLIGFLSVATMLIIISTDRLYNISGKMPSGHTAARVAFAGYVLMAIGNFGSMYLLGLDPDRVY